MIVHCTRGCGADFDDEFRDTICPHQTFAANDGKGNFAHHPESFIGLSEAEDPNAMGLPGYFRGVNQLESHPTPGRPGYFPAPGDPPFRLQDLTPVRDRLIVAPLAVSSRSKGGIHLVETGHQRERPQHGIVLATGAGVWNPGKTERVPVEAQVGDCVFYGKYSGQAFDIGDREVLNMSEAEVFSILRQGAFILVEHENPKLNHLQGDFCDLCATPEELAAKARLEAERIALVEAQAGERPVTLLGTFAPALAAPGLTNQEATDELSAHSALEAERERLRQLREAQS